MSTKRYVMILLLIIPKFQIIVRGFVLIVDY